MIKKIISIVLITIIAIFTMQLNAQAVVVSTDKQVESGSGTVTISVTSNQPLGAYTLTLTDTAGLTLVGATGGEVSADKKTIVGSSSSGVTSLGNYTFNVPTVSTDTKYNVRFSISNMETPDLQAVPNETNTATITVKAPVTVTPDPTPEQPSNPGTTEKPSTPTETKSTNANLKKLGINPKEYDFTNFKQSRTNYTTKTIPNNIEEVEVWYEVADSKSKVQITADKGLKVNNNKVSGLKEGKNTITVTVTAESGATKKYKISVTRQEANAPVEEPTEQPTDEQPEEPVEPQDNETTETIGDGIKKLSIVGITLKPEFSTDVYEYEAVLTEDKEKLDIETEMTSEDYKVVIAGNEKLKNGENIVTLIVYDAQNTVVATYQITVMKNTIDQNEINNMFGQVKKEEMIKRIAIISVLVLIVILIIVYIVIKIKMKKSKDKNTGRKNKDMVEEYDINEEIGKGLEEETETEAKAEEEEEKPKTSKHAKIEDEEDVSVKNSIIIEDNEDKDAIIEEKPVRRRRRVEETDLENEIKIEAVEEIDAIQTEKKKGKHF